MYGYYWGHTAAQIELMAVDQPMVVYNHDNDKKGKKNFKKASVLDVIKAACEWKDKYDGKDEKVKLDFSGFNIEQNK